MDHQDGLIAAYLLDGRGGGRPLDWNSVAGWAPTDGPLWIHLDRKSDAAALWVRQRAGLDHVVADALLAEETRPRADVIGDGLLVILRGANLNPGAEPEDMVSVRLWLEHKRVISLRANNLMAIQDLRDRTASGHGPADTGQFLVELASALLHRMGPVIQGIDDQIDELEDQVVQGRSTGIRSELAALRRQTIALRRYVAPQRDALSKLQFEPVNWFTTADRSHLREVADRVTRYVEDLDTSRERAAVTQDELTSRIGEQMNRTMYVLSLVAAIFLPLGLITGLLGINVGGIPGAENHWAFVIVCAVLLSMAGIQLWMFRRMRWL